MSGQVDDNFLFNEKEYILAAIEYPKHFLDFEQFKLKPIEFDTSCWRGFINTFAIDDNKLVLDRIYTNNGNKKNFKIPKINGKTPKIMTNEDSIDDYKYFRILDYTDLKFKINYGGSIIIARDFIQKYYVHMGFQSPIFYKEIIKLEFQNGELISTLDISDFAESIRQNRKKYSKKDKEFDVINRIFTGVDLFFNNDVEKLFKEKGEKNGI